MRWGVPYGVIVTNVMLVTELFLLTRNLLMLAAALPLHGVAAMLCHAEPRFFELCVLWLRTRVAVLLVTGWQWRASSYGALPCDPRGNSRGGPPCVRV